MKQRNYFEVGTDNTPMGFIRFVALIALLFTLLYLSSCKKKESVTAPPIIANVQGAKWAGDDCKDKALYFGYFLGNNSIIIEGNNFGSLGEITCNNPYLEISEVDWSNERISFFTTCEYDKDLTKTPVIFTIRTEDDLEVKTKPLDFVSDNLGYAYRSNWGEIIQYFEDKKTIVPTDFMSDFQPCDADYIPDEDDVILVGNQYLIITAITGVTANGYQRSTNFTAVGEDCKGNDISLQCNFTSKTDGTVITTANMPSKYLQL